MEVGVRKLKILHLTNELQPGGVTSVIYDLCSVQKGTHDVRIGALRRGDWDHRIDIPVAVGANLIPEIINADIVHCHHRTLSLLARTMRRKGVVDHVHNLFSNRRALSFRGNVVVCVATQIETNTLEQFPHTKGRTRTIVNGIDDPLLPAVRDCERTRNSLTVIGAGRLETQKDPIAFLAILSELRDRGVDFSASWFGDGTLRADFLNQIQEFNLSEYVELHGWISRDELLRRISQADVFLLTSRWEGMPMTAVESLAVGTPVASTRVGYLTEMLAAKHPELVVDLGNLDLLFEAVESLSKSTCQRRDYRRSAREIWNSNFNLQKKLSEWEDVYRDALN